MSEGNTNGAPRTDSSPDTCSPTSCSFDIEKPDVEGLDEGSVQPGSKMRVKFRSNFSAFFIGVWFFEILCKMCSKKNVGEHLSGEHHSWIHIRNSQEIL